MEYLGFSQKDFFLKESDVFHNYVYTTTCYQNEQPTYPDAGEKLQERMGLSDGNITLFGLQVSVKCA
jgi:hypothetical protein